MSLLPSLLAAIVVTWLTRIAFIALLPTDRLPPAVTVALEAAAPAVLGALTVMTLLHVRVATASVTSQLLPLAVAALLARRGANLGVVVIAAIGAATALRLVGW